MTFQIKAALIKPMPTKTTIGAYVLTADDTNSRVHYASNILIPTPAWAKGANLTGVYSILRGTSTPANILVYSSGVLSAPGTCTPNEARGSTTITELGGGWYHLDVSTINYSPGGGNFYAASLSLVGDSCTACEYWAVANMIGYTPPNGIGTHNGGLDNCASAWTGFPNFAGSWQTYYYSQGYDASEWTRLDIRSTTAWSMDFTFSASGVVGAPAVARSDDDGATWDSPLAIGSGTIGPVGGVDVQRNGANSFAAGKDAVYRATTLGGVYTSYYSITGGTAQATCIIVPYFKWDGSSNTSATNPDIIVALNQADGSGRTLLWIEGGATPGTVHDLTPTGTPLFSAANCVTVHYQHHLACYGAVSGVNHLFTSNDKGTTWVDRGAITGTPAWIRCRRNDSTGVASGSNIGQLYLARGGVVDYSSKWGASGGPDTGMYPRTLPMTTVRGLDTIW